MLAKEEGEMRIQKYDTSSLILGMGVFEDFLETQCLCGFAEIKKCFVRT